nr:MAG TPA: hypothetical protein [Caudoviricetes sp.]
MMGGFGFWWRHVVVLDHRAFLGVPEWIPDTRRSLRSLARSRMTRFLRRAPTVALCPLSVAASRRHLSPASQGRGTAVAASVLLQLGFLAPMKWGRGGSGIARDGEGASTC